jgi:replicative DNA helicase
LTTIAGLLRPDDIDIARFLRDDTPTDRTLDHWIRVVKKSSLEGELKNEAGKDDMDSKRVEALAYEINSLAQEPVSLYQSIQSVARLSDNPSLLIRTGLLDVDRNYRLRRGGLLVIAGRTGTGKTSLGTQMIYQMSKTRPVGLVSLEMTAPEVREHIENSFGDIPDRNFFIADPSALSSIELKRILKRMKDDQGVEVILIDYLQLLREREDFRSRALEISHIIRKTKEFAKELNLALIVISTLNRSVGEGERPSLGDLKESGDIEYAADAVLFIHEPEGEKFKVLILAKNRWGHIGDIKILWDGPRTRFTDYRDAEVQDPQRQGNLYEVDHDGQVTY